MADPRWKHGVYVGLDYKKRARQQAQALMSRYHADNPTRYGWAEDGYDAKLSRVIFRLVAAGGTAELFKGQDDSTWYVDINGQIIRYIDTDLLTITQDVAAMLAAGQLSTDFVCTQTTQGVGG